MGVASAKKKAIEIVEIMEKNAAESKKPLSAAEKKQVVEQIEANSVREMEAMKEDLLEEAAFARKQFGHKLNPAEEKLAEKYVINFENQMAMNQLADAFGGLM